MDLNCVRPVDLETTTPAFVVRKRGPKTLQVHRTYVIQSFREKSTRCLGLAWLCLDSLVRARYSIQRQHIKKVTLYAQNDRPKWPVAEFFSMDALHTPLQETPSESASESLLAWLQQAFDVANHAFFNGELQGVQIEIDNSWHLRGGAGGAHPGKQCIVLDPSVHLCYRDLCATLLHEMLHLQVGDADREEHGPVFLQACMELNTTLMESGAACFCRLGEFDTALDQSLLAKAGTPVDVRDALLHGRPSSSDSWDSKLLVGDLCFFCDEAGLPEEKALELAARIQCLAVVTSCKIALQKGYVTWSLRSRTMARHCASNVGRDYQSFPDYAALWLL